MSCDGNLAPALDSLCRHRHGRREVIDGNSERPRADAAHPRARGLPDCSVHGDYPPLPHVRFAPSDVRRPRRGKRPSRVSCPRRTAQECRRPTASIATIVP
jgi:hypothetical protein